jgi:predicted transcriptional regulator
MSLQFPKDIDLNKHPFMKFTAYRWNATGKINQSVTTTKNSVGTVILPFSESGLNDSISSNWSEEEGLLVSGGKDAAAKYFKSKVKEMAGELYKFARYRQGSTLNDFASLLYEGVGFREFPLTFNLVPKNLDEATTIENIVKFFKRNSLPHYREQVMDFPNFWQISAVFPGNKNVTHFRSCVITSLEFNYFPDSIVTVFKSGHPIKITASITFKELEKLDKDMF